MKTLNHFEFLLSFVSRALSVIIFQDYEPEDNAENEPECYTCNIVRKPTIYIYPAEKIRYVGLYPYYIIYKENVSINYEIRNLLYNLLPYTKINSIQP